MDTRLISFHNKLGQIVTYPVVSEFTDADGFVYYVYGPVERGMFDTSCPYDVRRKGEGEWVSTPQLVKGATL